jgi:hypothetical protein
LLALGTGVWRIVVRRRREPGTDSPVPAEVLEDVR